MTSYEFERLRYFIPSSISEQNELYQLGDKAKSCWEYTGTQTATNVTISASAVKSISDYEACVIKSLGETAYKQIYSGVRTPTYEEHLKYEQCNSGQTKVSSVIYYTNEEKLPKTTEACLKTVLTGGTFDKVRASEADVPYELRDKVNRCFGVNPQPFEEARVYKTPDAVKNCLKEDIGEARFNEINSGSQPTDEEKKKGEGCFAKLNRDQTKFLPLPPEQVHFLETDPDSINVGEVKQETQKLKNVNIGGKVIFTGSALPNSVVNIYIYSEPIVVTTKTDENGDWVYELDQPLEGDKHIAYATVRNSAGKVVRSSVLDFSVVAADDIENLPQFLEEEGAVSSQNKIIIYAVILIIIAIVVVLVVQRFGYKKEVLPK
ncbi:hypothetical protein A2771_00780 [Candidatus Woesebacteria bacterium RIFCSPHIGHO2_01_FULL_38_26b]|uniref:Bacterial Ig-like domain-containing protein n=1 Tax=Candidatus Woesebacteria bacterium RIFCSPHIGHO2_01_FULL_38_26b TaxID=1802491 RepID=A0A1F7Y375_9BACT|nr:MAG: hypothetical protein A2771_00780 [Candidatus Woesebacteria bacterium RIFCSPHIGHO2_01_FULL_38_26b]